MKPGPEIPVKPGPRMTAQAWHTLSAAQRKELERLSQREIRDALSE